MSEPKKVLIAEDDKMIAEAVKAYLGKDGYETIIAEDGELTLSNFSNWKPDLLILDRMLPKLSGEEICKFVRANSDIPIIMLTAKTAEEDKLEGFSLGADDYVTKPFSPRELVARVNSLIRRASKGNIPLCNEMHWNNGDLSIYYESHQVRKNGENAGLTPNEYKIFQTLSTSPQKIFTREELIEIAFGMDFQGYDRTIDSHIKNLRGKIEDNPAQPIYIITIRGVGYSFGSEKIE